MIDDTPTSSLKPFAVVTGGSSGLGYALAKQFVTNGYEVLIVAERAGPLAEAAQALSHGGGAVRTHAADLATEAGVDELYAALQALGRPVDVLCLNAGFGLSGAFAETNLRRELKMIDLNVRGSVQLTKLVLNDMLERDHGRLLFVSSIAATMPDPFEAVCGATKVFLRWFGESLRNELKDTNVGVTVLMPSATDTLLLEGAEILGAKVLRENPSVIAEAAFEALQRDGAKAILRAMHKVMAHRLYTLPDTAEIQAHRGMARSRPRR